MPTAGRRAEQKRLLPIGGSFLLLTLVIREDQLLLPGRQLPEWLGLCSRCQYVPAEAEEMLGLYFFLSLYRSIAGGEREHSQHWCPRLPDSEPQYGYPQGQHTHGPGTRALLLYWYQHPRYQYLGASSQPLGDKNLASGAQGEEPQVLATRPKKPHLKAPSGRSGR